MDTLHTSCGAAVFSAGWAEFRASIEPELAAKRFADDGEQSNLFRPHPHGYKGGRVSRWRGKKSGPPGPGPLPIATQCGEGEDQ